MDRPPAGSGASFAQAALRHGVAITPGAANSPDGAFPEYVRICYGATPRLLEPAARQLHPNAWKQFSPQPRSPSQTHAHP